MKIQRTLGTLALLGLIASSSAFAADTPASAPGQPGPLAQACKKDVETLCPGIQPGEDRIRQCMSKHRSKISPDCKKAMKHARAQQEASTPPKS
ncbi:MAG TPA: hypothetical protein VHQ87_02995 [Rhizobacter sp.]|jgi:hypothetical protein|nr:hypothetical protein [Rhizobacter sp.]